MTDQAQGNQPIAAEPGEHPTDGDSAIEGSVGNASDTTSLWSSIKNYVYENGRRYHSYHDGEYIIPNDEDEQDRMDLSHHVYKLLLGGELCRAPIINTQRVLDLGTGTGIWAIDFADEHPEAEVIGIDLSPIQPAWVPPNCKFEIDDFEHDWTFHQKFDFIHGRELEGSIRDHDRLFSQCFQNLRPGGYLEMKTIEGSTNSTDGTHLKAKNFLTYFELLREAANMFGKRMDTVGKWKEKMQQAGFKNVTMEKYMLPQNPWSEAVKLKELGVYNQENLLDGLRAYSLALFTRVLHWERTEIEAFLAGVRREVRDPSIHLYTNVYIVYGQKPDDERA